MTKAVACLRSGDIRTSVTETRWLASVSSWTSPRIRMSDSAWRTCSPTRSRRTDLPSGDSVRFIVSLDRHPGASRGLVEKGSVLLPEVRLRRDDALSQSPSALLDLEHLEMVARL